MERRAATPAGTARAEDPGLSESRHEERLLRVKAKRYEQIVAALISAKGAEIRQIEPFAVRLAEAVPAESVRSQRKSTLLALSLF
ncbi:hypothetical protein [Sporosarcina sp. UB5]|uniref:hypothetical protein n=1 Tax=Sporosarcina sp. UB5 TaxID=3047463 RepID=UPI003D7A39E7